MISLKRIINIVKIQTRQNAIIAFLIIDGSLGSSGSSPIDSRYSEYKSHKVKIYIGLKKIITITVAMAIGNIMY